MRCVAHKSSLLAMKNVPASLVQLCVLIIVTHLSTSTAADAPVVQTKFGPLKGDYLSVKGKPTVVHSYLGVPFAKPPVGPLRLAPPQPAERWEGVRHATQQPFMCLQERQMMVDLMANFSMDLEFPEVSEDCLYLNIYTPSKPAEDGKLPVMVFIHGGGFAIGSASMSDGSVLAAYENVVVVLIQYRLGLLGFFSTGDEHAPGNYGLLDQVAALQWVQENIHNFGGDPASVTIFGESAGGVSVSLQILSPMSAGLFRGAIAESGTATINMLMNLNPLPMAQMMGNASGCDITSSQKIVDCVMQLSAEEIMTVLKENKMLAFGVTKDGQFLPKTVEELLKTQEFHKVPLITGVTDDEAGWLLPSFFAPEGWVDGMDREQVLPLMAMFYTDPKDQWICEAIADEYLGTAGDRIKTREGFTELLGDMIFNIPALKVAHFHSDAGAPVYLYEFQHAPSMLQKKRPSFVGTDHGDELPFVFGACFSDTHIKMTASFTKEEDQLCKTVMAYWGNFARTGSPNGPGLVPWPQYGAEGEYLGIGLEQQPGEHLKAKHYTFMTETLPEKIRLAREKTEHSEAPVVQTKFGPLKGDYLSVKGKPTVVHSYLGVPFAKPPVGPLRLAPPQPAEKWEGVRDATQQPLMCLQDRQIMVDLMANFSMDFEFPEVSEDCLYLNIYTPSKPAEDGKLPVMVFIHGGGFAIGSASMSDGSVLAAYENVVVVLIQYRLGLLGFLSTGDEHAPGNYGLLDQVAALQWVQENIHNFGGDPASVTIFGESAGGVSVSLQILSPMSAGLFRGAIAESGTAAINMLMNLNPLPMAQMMANASGCDITSSQKIVDCVMQLSAEEIMSVLKENKMLAFGVTKDGQFLPKTVEELLKTQEFHKVPLITGVTDDEAGWLLPSFFAPEGWVDGMDREQVLPLMAMFYTDPKDQWICEAITDEYLGTAGDRIKTREGFTELLGDMIFNIPALKVAHFHSDAGAPVYLYEFQHAPSMLQKKRPSFVGTDHGDELAFVFGACFSDAHIKMTASFTKEEEQLCKTVMAYWGNFARTGSPNGPGLVPWPQYGAEGEYLGIGLEQQPGEHLKAKHYTFMTETLPEKIRLAREKTEHSEAPVVQTKFGPLKGDYLSVKGKPTVVHSYLGVPFAKPPVGPLRLAPPQPAEKWEGVRDATQQPLMCLQDRQIMVDLMANFSMDFEFPEVSEDCLYLNIYTPSKPAEDGKLPVMVFIHGGGFAIGSASMSDGSVLAAYENVVVVLIQYRLGLLGFLSTGDEHAPGNYGLLDQVAALQWVQENIHNFGGDPASVTIFGESAGGVSVSLQILSPMSAGLFRGAIAESGTAAINMLMNLNPLPMAQMMANASGCDITSSQKIVDCVMQLSAEEIMSVLKENKMLAFGVTKDGQFLPKTVEELLKTQEFHKVPLITGVTDDEAGWLLPSFFAPEGWVDGMDREQVLPLMAMFYTDPKDQWICEAITDEYLGTAGDRIKTREGFTELLGDMIFNIPALKVAHFHSDAGAPVYLYEFQHAPSMLQKKRPSFVGTDHGDELAFVFGACFSDAHIKMTASFTKEEEQLCKTVMAYWGNFARTGSPNGPGLVPWPQYGAEGEYLGIGLEQQPGEHLKAKHYTFMTETLPEKIRLAREKTEHSEAPVVQTKFGPLKGDYLSVKGKPTVVHSYLGVPFAKPPVGPLRLAPPQPAEKWEGVRDATQQPLMCLQDRQIMVDLIANFSMDFEFPEVSEDCLYLNIYTPSKPAEDGKLPVMVFIHGGGFAIGSASVSDGSVLAAYENVVVVLIQYRLGLLGFLSTGDEHAPGNYGLLDQVAALQWVQENIHKFGGDPASVTIFGESAGGVSVSLQILSPMSAGLFCGAIAESGTAAMDIIINLNPLPVAQMVVNASGCDITSSQKIVDCVMQLSAEEIMTVLKENKMLSFGVTKDGRFLPRTVEELLKSQEFHKVPLITGVTDDEAGWLLTGFFAPEGWVDGMDREQVLQRLAMFYTDPKDQWICEAIADEYLGTAGDRIKTRESFIELLGDVLFNIPALKLAHFHSDAGAPVYLYEFQHAPSMLQKKRPSFVGTDHGDELPFVFGACFSDAHIKMTASFTKEEEQLCKTVMAYWGNFARTGSPNGPGLVPWPQYGAEGEYLGIGLEQQPGEHLKAKHYTFMAETLPEKIRLAREKTEHSEL